MERPIATFQRWIALVPESSGVGVSVLLRQPHGFEGLCMVVKRPVVDDPAVLESEDVGKGRKSNSIPVCRIFEWTRMERNDTLACVDELVQVDTDPLRRLYPGSRRLRMKLSRPRYGSPTWSGRIAFLIDGVGSVKRDGDLRREDALKGPRLWTKHLPIPRRHESSDLLHVLLRHRPRSIAQAQESA